MLDRDDVEALPRPLLERGVALCRIALAGLVRLAAEHQQLSIRGRHGTQRVCRALVAQVHALRDRSPEADEEDVRTLRMSAGEEHSSVEDREMRRDDHVSGANRKARVRPELTGISLTDAHHTCPLMDAAADLLGGVCQTVQVGEGMEFGLVSYEHRRGHRVRKLVYLGG